MLILADTAVDTLKKNLLAHAATDEAKRQAIEKMFTDFAKSGAIDDPEAAAAIAEVLKDGAKPSASDDDAEDAADGGDDEAAEGEADDGKKPDDVGKVFIGLRKAVGEILADSSGADKAELLNESFGMAWDATANIANEAINKAFAAGAAANPAGEPGNTVTEGSKMTKSHQELAAAQAEIAKLHDYNEAVVKFLASANDADRASFAKLDDPARRKVLKLDVEEVEKSGLPVELKKHFEKLEKRAEAAEAAVAKFVEERAIEDFAKRAVEIGQPKAFGETLRKLHAADPAAAKALEAELVAKNKQIEKSGLFLEIGKSGEAGDANTRVSGKADEIRKADPKLSKAQAYAKALTPEDYEASLRKS